MITFPAYKMPGVSGILAALCHPSCMSFVGCRIIPIKPNHNEIPCFNMFQFVSCEQFWQHLLVLDFSCTPAGWLLESLIQIVIMMESECTTAGRVLKDPEGTCSWMRIDEKVGYLLVLLYRMACVLGRPQHTSGCWGHEVMMGISDLYLR